ncbi:MAG: hypothetical protein CNC89_03420 [Puniceicoccaceae bacterium MED-G31]|nr:MAG: hypothetical protein CNC89_03420 [Puniceicoccaceae bacterium MED-G31]
MRSFLLILILLSGCISLLSYEQGTYFFCLAFKGSQAPAGRIVIAADVFNEKAQKEANKQKIATQDGTLSNKHTSSTQSLDLGTLAGTRKNKKDSFFDTKKLFQKDPTKLKSKPKEEYKINSFVP